MNLLADLAAALVNDGIETPPAEWQTIEQWAESAGFRRAHAGDLLRRGLAAGKVERKKFRVRTTDGVRPILHYRRIP